MEATVFVTLHIVGKEGLNVEKLSLSCVWSWLSNNPKHKVANLKGLFLMKEVLCAPSFKNVSFFRQCPLGIKNFLCFCSNWQTSFGRKFVLSTKHSITSDVPSLLTRLIVKSFQQKHNAIEHKTWPHKGMLHKEVIILVGRRGMWKFIPLLPIILSGEKLNILPYAAIQENSKLNNTDRKNFLQILEQRQIKVTAQRIYPLCLLSWVIFTT